MTLGLRARHARALSKLLCIFLSALSVLYCDGVFAELTPKAHAAPAPLPVAPSGRLFAWTPQVAPPGSPGLEVDVPINWVGRSKESAATIAYGSLPGTAVNAGLLLPLDPDQPVFNNVTFGGAVPPGNMWASWPQYPAAQPYQLRRIRATFTVPPEFGTVRDLVFYSPYYPQLGDRIPINDNVYLYVNGTFVGGKGTSYGAFGGFVPESDGWNVENFGPAAAVPVVPGVNTIDFVLEEWNSWGGFGELKLRLRHDGAPPTLTTPAPVVVDVPYPATSASVSLSTTVTDPDCNVLGVKWTVDGGPVGMIDTIPSGTTPTLGTSTFTKTYTLGTHTVHVTANDGSHDALADTTVTIRQTQQPPEPPPQNPPTVVCELGQHSLWPPDHEMIDVSLLLSGLNLSPNLVYTVKVYSNDEDDEQSADGKHSPDAATILPGGSGRVPLYVRRERTGSNDGRVYLVVVTATDAQGRTSRHCCTVTIPKSQSKKDKEDVAALAAQAEATCTASGSPVTPFLVGDGPVLGPKQVPAAAQTYLKITPADATLAPGATQTYTAAAVANNGTATSVTATWSSSAPSVATITAAGTAQAVVAGTTVLTAASGGLTGTTTLTVAASAPPPTPTPGPTPPPASGPQTLTIFPHFVRLLAAGSAPYVARRTLPDGSFEDVTAQVTWSSSNPSVGTIDAAGAMTVTGVGTSSISATLDGVTVSGPLHVLPRELVEIEVQPNPTELVVGTTRTFYAKAHYNDCTHELVSGATWSSSDPALATVGPTGAATGILPGFVDITATKDGKTGSARVEVVPVRLIALTVYPGFVSQYAGLQIYLSTFAVYNNNSSVGVTVTDWTTSDPTVASLVSPNVFQTHIEGTVTVTATLDGVTGTGILNVLPPYVTQYTLDPFQPTIPKGTDLQLSATIHYSNQTTKDITSTMTSWVSNAPEIATVSATGKVTGVSQGWAFITASGTTATVGGWVFISDPLLVQLQVLPENASIAKGVSDQYTARGTLTDGTFVDLTTQVTWSSDDAAIASVNTTGLATGNNLGTTTIRAQFGALSGSASLTVTPAILVTLVISPLNATVRKGLTRQFTLTGTYTDGTVADVTSLAIWTSDDNGVATVSPSGLATGLSVGTTDLHAAIGGLTIAAHLTVIPAPVVSIAVTPAASSIPVGFTKQYTATATRADGSSDDVTAAALWQSANTTVALIDADGLAFGNAPGTSQISATYDGVTGMTTVTVTQPVLTTITVSPASATRALGRTVQYIATGTFDDGTVINVTGSVVWSTGDASVATIGPSGLAATVGVGATSITATKDGISGAASITVTPAELVQILVNPANALVPQGLSLQYTATGRYTDNTTQDLTSVAAWTSSDPTVATITAGGFATSVGAGISTLRATYNGLTGAGLITGVAPVLQTLTIAPPSAVILKTRTQQFTLTGGYSDGSTQDLTAQAVWQSSDPSVAVVNATGLATGVNFGTAVISATLSGTTVSAGLGVAPLPPPPLVQITSPAPDSVVTEAVQITGSTTSGYTLEYSPAGSGQFFPFGSGTGAVTNGTLGSFDPTVLLNGIYTVRLTATDEFGQSASTTFEAIADGQVKIGLFTLSFTDLNIPVEGIPVTVFRNYDSRVKTSGDFGIGWRLDLKTLSLQTKDKPGEGGWEAQPIGFLSQYRLVRTGPHYVAVTMGDGRVEKFDFEGNPAATFGGTVFNPPVLRPRSGTTSTLEAVTDPEVLFSDGVLFDMSLRVWEPEDYVLTAKDGTRFRFNIRRGLEQVQDTNGNTLTISPTGLTHSSGVTVPFLRDASNRITKVTDPLGHSLEYGYDPAGNLISSKDREGNITTYTYDTRSNLQDIVDPLGRRATRNEYDDAGRLIASIDADGNRVEVTHNPALRQEVVKDRNGNQTVYAYDARGNIVSTTDALGHTVTSTYDTDDNETSRTDQLGNTTTFAYDSRRNMLSQSIIVDGVAVVTAYTYSGLGKVLTTTDPLLRTTTNTYDAAGNLLTTVDPAGNLTQSEYVGGRHVATTDPLGTRIEFDYDSGGREVGRRVLVAGVITKQTTQSYDASGRPLTVTRWAKDSGGTFQPYATTTTAYDKSGNVIEVRDPLGHSTFTAYDGAGKRVSNTDKNGHVTNFTYNSRGILEGIKYPPIQVGLATVRPEELVYYDAEGNPTSRIDRNGNSTATEYDKLKRPTKHVNPDGSSRRTTFDPVGRIVGQTDERGKTKAFEYDALGRTKVVRDALNQAMQFEYNAAGQQTSMTDSLNRQTQFEYDLLGRLTKVTFADGTVRLTGYDALDRVSSKTDEEGLETRFGYAPTGELVEVLQPNPTNPSDLSTSTRFVYDELGRKVEQVDALGRRTQYTYSLRGELVSRRRPMGQTESFTYDPQGNLRSRTDAMGQAVTYDYNALNLLALKSFPDGSGHALRYFPGGQLSGFTITSGGNSETTSYVLDNRNRRTLQTNPDGSQLNWEYDAAGNLSVLRSPNQLLTYTYSERNELREVFRDGALWATYGYDPVGNRTTLLYANGTLQQLGYNSKNQLLSLTNKSGSSSFSGYSYVLDARGMRKSVTELGGRSVTYSYDALSRLVQEQTLDSIGTTTTNYSLDLVGNRTQKQVSGPVGTVETTAYSYNDNDELLDESGPAGSVSYAYNLNGELISKTGGGVAVGYGWDFEHRLISATSSGGSLAFAYDINGVRTSRSVNGTATLLYVDTNRAHSRVLEESTSGATAVTYAYGDDILSQARGGQHRYYHFDGHWNARQLSDAAGTVTDTYQYDAFGSLLSTSGSTANTRLYASEELDPELGLYYLRSRYYHAAVGRFTSPDSFAGDPSTPASLHKYLYGNAEPVNSLDPGGTMTFSQFSFAVFNFSIQVAIRWPSIMYYLTVADLLVSLAVCGIDAIPDSYVNPNHGTRTPVSLYEVGDYDDLVARRNLLPEDQRGDIKIHHVPQIAEAQKGGRIPEYPLGGRGAANSQLGIALPDGEHALITKAQNGVDRLGPGATGSQLISRDFFHLREFTRVPLQALKNLAGAVKGRYPSVFRPRR